MPRSKSPVARHVLSSKSAVKPVALTNTQTVHHQYNVEVERPGFFSNMWQGFGLGAGQAIAHNVFRSDPEVNDAPTEEYSDSIDVKVKSDLMQEYHSLTQTH
jgi:hypothetical protein